MKKFVFSVASRATGRLQIKPSGSGDENGVVLEMCARMSDFFFQDAFTRCVHIRKFLDI